MADIFKFELVSPERLLVSEDVDAITLPGAGGDMTILDSHAPVMTTLRPGIVSVTKPGGATEEYVVFGGFADVTVTGCTVLAEDATPRGEMSREAMSERLARAREENEAARGSGDHERLTRAEEFLGQLTTLEQQVLPA